MTLRRWALVVLFFFCSTGAVRPDSTARHVSSTDKVVTPHISWLKPSFAGPVKALFIVSRQGMREVCELTQRMDLDATVFIVSQPGTFFKKDKVLAPDATEETAEEELTGKLEPDYDVILIGDVKWDILPLFAQYLILKKVKEGTSLFGVIRSSGQYMQKATGDKTEINPSIVFPFRGLPAFRNYSDFKSFIDSTVDCYQFGKGKIISLKGYGIPFLQSFTPGITGSPFEAPRIEYDYYLAYICHLINLSAGRKPDILIQGNDYVKTGLSSPLVLKYRLSAGREQEISCIFTLRNIYNEIVSTGEIRKTVGTSGTDVEFHAGKISGGKYFADIWVKKSGKICNFASSFVEAISDTCITDIEIQKSYAKTDRITGRVHITDREGLEGLAVRVTWSDNFGRVLRRSTVPAGEGGIFRKEAAFSFAPAEPLTVVQHIRAELMRGGEPLDMKQETFSLSDCYPPGDIRYIVWSGVPANSYLSVPFLEPLRQAGFDTQLSGTRNFNQNVPLANLWHLDYTTRIYDIKSDWYSRPAGVSARTKNDHVRTPCLSDPQYLHTLEEQLVSAARTMMPFSNRDFSLGDECHFVSGPYMGYAVELCFSPTCVERFHRFLQEEYKTVDALNAEYSSEYTSFEQVQPVTLEEAEKDARLVPLWVDYRTHMENTWAGIFRFGREVIQREIPSAKVGYEGSDTEINTYRAANFFKLMRAMNLNCPYTAPFVNHAVADFAQPGTLLALGWDGGYLPQRSDVFQRYITWRHLFTGANAFFIFFCSPSEGGPGITAPDFSFYDFFKANIREVSEMKRGVGKLLISSSRENDDIALLYSGVSVHLSALTPSLPDSQNVLNSLSLLFEDIGYQYRTVSDEEVAGGCLCRDNYRLLVMPFVQALSKKETVEIAQFVRKGGTVIADLRPGVCDEHGKPYATGILDEIFGVKQQTDAARALTGAVSVKMPGVFSGILPAVAADASLAATTGTPNAGAGNTPCLIVNKCGNGTAVLLNFSLSGYAQTSGVLETSAVSTGTDAPLLRTFFKKLLSYTGIKEKVTVSPEVPGLRTYRFQTGELEYLGLLGELPEPAVNYVTEKAKPLVSSATKITLDRKYHIYNVREGEYLGYTDEIKTAVEPGRAQLYSLLPYRIQKIEPSLPDRIARGAEMPYQITITGTQPAPGLHTVHLSLFSPDGSEVPYYSKNLAFEQGQLKGVIRFALNEHTGKWTLKVRDTASGVSAEKTFVIVPEDGEK